MGSRLQYRPLFSVEMLHDFYLSEDLALYNESENLRDAVLAQQRAAYRLSGDLSIHPTKDCSERLKDNQLIFRQNPTGFTVAARVVQPAGMAVDEFTPFVALDQPITLRFAVLQQNANFGNITNLRMDKGVRERERYVYYFSNRTQNIVSAPGIEDRLYISQEMADFNSDTDYEAGELIQDGSGELLEAIQDIAAGSPFIPPRWRTIYDGQDPHFQFVTTLDRVALRPHIFRHAVRNETESHASVVILLRDGQNALLATYRFDAFDPQDPAPVLDSCTLDLRGFEPGRYNLAVQELDGTPIPDFDLSFYMDDILFRERPLAVIECAHVPGGSLGDYRWLDETIDNVLRQPVYRIRWKNRPTWWRYYFREAPAFSAVNSDVDNLHPAPVNPNHRILISNEPLALTQITRRVELALNDGDILLPNPDVRSIFPENGRVFSEINMGGGLGPPA